MQDTVYISTYLTKIDRGKLVVAQFRKLEADGYFRLQEIQLNRNEWCRDYMPVKGADNRMALFKYRPPYLVGTKSGEASFPDQKQLCRELGINYADATDVVLDGGAIDVYGDAALVSKKFLVVNGGERQVADTICDRLGLRRVIAVPPDPWDFTGHVDGLVRFIDSNTVLVNDYGPLDATIEKESLYMQKKYFGWKECFDTALIGAGFTIKQLPSAFYQNRGSSAQGIYLNFLLLPEYILMPAFANHAEENQAAAQMLRECYNREVLFVWADAIAEKGGVINCITWTAST